MKALAQLTVYFKRYKWMLILGILFITISNFFGVLAPGLIRNAFDSIGEWIAKANVEGMTREVVLEGAMKAALWYAFMYMIYTLLKGLFHVHDLHFAERLVFVLYPSDDYCHVATY
jgi:ATP-binding cassette subfamily B protein